MGFATLPILKSGIAGCMVAILMLFAWPPQPTCQYGEYSVPWYRSIAEFNLLDFLCERSPWRGVCRYIDVTGKTLTRFGFDEELVSRPDTFDRDSRERYRRHYGIELEGRSLRFADFSEAWLNGARLGRSDLSCAKMEYTRLYYADLGFASMYRTYMQWALMSGADMVAAKLEGAILREARLNGVNLRGAELTDADVREARLNGALLHDTNIRGSSFVWAQVVAAVGTPKEHEDAHLYQLHWRIKDVDSFKRSAEMTIESYLDELDNDMQLAWRRESLKRHLLEFIAQGQPKPEWLP